MGDEPPGVALSHEALGWCLTGPDVSRRFAPLGLVSYSVAVGLPLSAASEVEASAWSTIVLAGVGEHLAELAGSLPGRPLHAVA